MLEPFSTQSGSQLPGSRVSGPMTRREPAAPTRAVAAQSMSSASALPWSSMRGYDCSNRTSGAPTGPWLTVTR
ncbi:hypothetical protein ACQ86F_20025 [Streptomyces venezuelae ATCC 10712]